MASLARLEEDYPWINWRKPISIGIIGGKMDSYACRICIHDDGLKAKEFEGMTEEEVRKHIADVHVQE